MSEGLDRRAFVTGAGKAVALGLAAPGLLSALAGCRVAPGLDDGLLRFYADPTAAARVGAAYLKVVPEENDRNVLLERLAGPRLDEWERLAREDEAALGDALRAQVREDFRGGRVIRLHGWLLARTEARLCALAALA